jgi:hypothetical protein
MLISYVLTSLNNIAKICMPKINQYEQYRAVVMNNILPAIRYRVNQKSIYRNLVC